MEEHEAHPDVEWIEQDLSVKVLEPWQQPKLERLHVSLDTANSPGSGNDLGNMTKAT